MIPNRVPSMRSCTYVDPEGLSLMNEFGVTRYAVAEHVIFVSSALNGDRISLLMNVGCELDSSEIITLS